MNHDPSIAPPGTKIRLEHYGTGFTRHYKNKPEASAKLRTGIERLAKYRDLLYVQDAYALLVILQVRDITAKDGAIRLVMSGVNPLDTQLHLMKAPSPEKLNHDLLWRSMQALPERGGIGIFNRSYGESVGLSRE